MLKFDRSAIHMVLCGAAVTTASACSPSCSNEVLSRVPNGAGIEAVAFTRNCGATTGENLHVSVLDAGALPSGTGNAFVSNGSVSINNSKGNRIWWSERGELVISYPLGEEVFSRSERVGGKSIKFVEVQQN